MRTIRENLEEAIKMLKSDKISKHSEAAHLVYLDLSSVQGLDKSILHLLALYREFLTIKWRELGNKSFFVKILIWWKKMKLKAVIKKKILEVEVGYFGDGQKYILKIANLIKNSL